MPITSTFNVCYINSKAKWISFEFKEDATMIVQKHKCDSSRAMVDMQQVQILYELVWSKL